MAAKPRPLRLFGQMNLTIPVLLRRPDLALERDGVRADPLGRALAHGDGDPQGGAVLQVALLCRIGPAGSRADVPYVIIRDHI